MLNSYQIDKKLEPILNEMHQTGVEIDVDFLKNMSQELGLKLLKLESNIYSAIGHEFNINSPSQLAKILYEELKIQPKSAGIKKGKTHHSTNATDLAKIEHLHPSIKYILEYRELGKLKSTYLDPLPKLADGDNRIHTTYTIETSTGRLSSKNPNLQNIPIRTDIGKEIRKAFIAKEGHELLVCDYSQIELRIAANFSHDEAMMKVFKEGKDIHKATALELGVDRRTAKTVNFGILYGISAYGLSESLKISKEEAQSLIDKYFANYPRLRDYIFMTIENAKKNGYVETLYKRKREIPEFNSPIDAVRKFAERVAINTPFQGTAAEIIKLAMIEIDKKLAANSNQLLASSQQQSASSQQPTAISNQLTAEGKSTPKAVNYKLKASMILQVHDELVFEVPKGQIETIASEIRNIMENPVKLDVPIIVDVKKGKNWGDLSSI